MNEQQRKRAAAIAALALAAAAVAVYAYADRFHSDAVTTNGKPIEFVMPDLDGKTWKLSDHRGSVVLLNFWATWCEPCRRETPGLVRIAQEYRDRGLVVAGVAMDDEGADAARAFAKEFAIPYPILIPPHDSPLFSAIQALPVTMLFDRGGRVVRRYEGAVSESQWTRDIGNLLH